MKRVAGASVSFVIKDVKDALLEYSKAGKEAKKWHKENVENKLSMLANVAGRKSFFYTQVESIVKGVFKGTMNMQMAKFKFYSVEEKAKNL